MDNKRNVFIDILKGVAIFLMLWGHCIQYGVVNTEIDFFNNYVFKFIYSFHMPLFMLVSGYLFFHSFSKRELKDLLIYKTQTLLQPILFCSFFNFIITKGLLSVLGGDLKVIIDGTWLKSLSSLWFLWSVLASLIVTAIVCKIAKKLYVQIILFVVMGVIVVFFPNYDMNLYMFPYFVLGFYFAKYKDKLPKFVYALKYVSLIAFPVLLCFFEKKHYIYTTGIFPNDSYSIGQMLSIDAFRWLIGLVGSIFVITILELVYKNVTQKLKKPMITNALSCMGEKSIQMYVFSVPFLSFYFPWIFSKVLSVLNIENVFAKNTLVYNFVFTFLVALAYAIFLYFFNKFLEKIKINKIMFRK